MAGRIAVGLAFHDFTAVGCDTPATGRMASAKSGACGSGLMADGRHQCAVVVASGDSPGCVAGLCQMSKGTVVG